MAPRTGRGRKPAKSEMAAGLIAALNFMGALKPPTGQQLMPYMEHTFLNGGWAIGTDGVLAMGHPITGEIAGYVHTKLFADALDNTSKTFTMSVTGTGALHIQSDKYEALVPALDPTTVPETYPDLNQWPLADGQKFIDALVAAGKVVSDNAETVLGASIRLNGETVMATDGVTVIEAYHGNGMPIGVVVPKVFATALAKTGKVPVGFGLHSNWQTLTVHFADNSWLRTNCYDPASWSNEVLQIFGTLFGGIQAEELDPKLFDAVAAVLPFAEDDNRVIIRPGLVRTHPDKAMGAALSLDTINFTIDLSGKRLLAVRDHAKTYAVATDGNGNDRLVFFGDLIRGVIAAMTPLPEPEPQAPAANWGGPQAAAGGWGTPAPAAAAGGWGTPSVAQTVAPPAEEAPQGWNANEAPKRDHTVADPNFRPGLTGAVQGMATDPEFLAGQADYDRAHGIQTDTRTVDDVDQTSDFDIGAWLAANQGTDTGEQG